MADMQLRNVDTLKQFHNEKKKAAVHPSGPYVSPLGGLGTASEGLASDTPTQAAYNDAIDNRLKELFSRSCDLLSLYDVLVQMRGAFPALVWEHICASGWKTRLGQGSSGTMSHRNEYLPELHPLDFEWYFTPGCADYLADSVCGRAKIVLCLGVPTVAAAAARKGRNVVVVDRNQLIQQRFPVLLRRFEIRLLDIADCEHHLTPADVVLFDAPWYLEDTCRWLAVAIRAAKPGGLIAFCLFPTLVRPTATAEREVILEAAATAGKVEVFEDAVAYETPVFESEALQGAGITGFGNWRRADLVFVQRTSAMPKWMYGVPSSRPRSKWITYLVGSRVVKVKCDPTPTSSRRGSVRPLPDSVDFVYSSVSARDSRRTLIDLWTSRNRVAQIENLESVTWILKFLQGGGPIDAAIKKVYRGSPASIRYEIEDAFQRLLGHLTTHSSQDGRVSFECKTASRKSPCARSN